MRTIVPSPYHGKAKRMLAWSINCTSSEASYLIRLDFVVSPSRKLRTLKEKKVLFVITLKKKMVNDTSNQKNMLMSDLC